MASRILSCVFGGGTSGGGVLRVAERDGDLGTDLVRARGVAGPIVRGEAVRVRDVGVVGVRKGSFCDDRDGV
jgi:hypothetical protein